MLIDNTGAANAAQIPGIAPINAKDTAILSALGAAGGLQSPNVENLAAEVGKINAQNPELAVDVRNGLLAILTPVDKGNFLRILDQQDSAAVSLQPMQAKGSTPTTTRPKQGPPAPVADATARTLDKPKSPEQAPSDIKLNSRINTEIQNLNFNAAQSGAGTQNGAIMADKKTGQLSFLAAGVNYDSSKYRIAGQIYSAANTDASVETPSIGYYAANIINGETGILISENGQKQSMMMRTNKSPASVNEGNVRAEYQANLDERVNAGFSYDDAVRYANMETAQKYGLAYYEGSEGNLKRIDTSQAGKPNFQTTPPAADPKKIAISNDFLSVPSVAVAPKQMNLAPDVQAKINQTGSQMAKDGQYDSVPGVIAFDKNTGQVSAQDLKKENPNDATGLLQVDYPSYQAVGGVFQVSEAVNTSTFEGSDTKIQAFSGENIAGFANGNYATYVLQFVDSKGKAKSEFMMVRTNQTPSNISAVDADARINELADSFTNSFGTNRQQAFEKAVAQFTQENGIALYKGKDGKFTKVN